MDPKNEPKGLDSPRNGRRAFWTVAVLCALLALVDPFYSKHVHYSWEGWFNFYSLYGFVSCLFLIFAAKALRRVVMRKEDYYDR
jgi:hypothetical protein